MLTITETAGAHLAQLLVENKASEDVTIRFLLVGEKLRPMLDNVRPGDVTFEHEGRTVLALDEPLSERFADTTLDLEEAGDGKHLRLR
jgi:Fe-S cluster assembly iron-binding protein IscA